MCWEQDEHRDCCRALGCSGIQWNPEPWQQPELSTVPKIRGELLSLQVGELPRARRAQQGQKHGQVRRELLTFSPCSSPSHPTPHLLLLQLIQEQLLCLVQNSCWQGLLAPSGCTTHRFAFLLLLLLGYLFFCLALLPFFPFVLPVGACRLW